MYNIGIDLGGTNIAVGVVDDEYRIVGRAKTKTRAERPVQEILNDMVKATHMAVENAGLTMDDIRAVGVASPGTVNPETGIIEYANNLPFRQTAAGSFLREKLGKPCYMNNDANAAAYGELLAGAGRGANNFLAVTLGTGVGGGIVIDGKIYTGFNHAGAELGHMIIVHRGLQCGCGADGCWEVYASASALIRQTQEQMHQHKDSLMWTMCKGDTARVDGRIAFDAMRAGDTAAAQVVDKYVGYVACGIISLINIFQPEFICIGGGISNEGETLLAPIREQVDAARYDKFGLKRTRLCIAKLGNDAGIIGAAMLEKQV